MESVWWPGTMDSLISSRWLALCGCRGMPTVAYRRRTPEAEPLYQALSGHLETFLAGTAGRGSAARGPGAPVGVELSLRDPLPPGLGW